MAEMNSDSVMPMVLTATYFAMQTTLDRLVVKGQCSSPEGGIQLLAKIPMRT